MQNFITIRLPPFVPQVCENSHQMTRLVFLGSFDSVQPRPLHRVLRPIRQMTSFRARMCLLGSWKQNFIFRPHSPQKWKCWSIFVGTNFRLKKALIMWMLTYKLPLIVIVAPWIDKSGYGNRNMGSPAIPYLQIVKGSRDNFGILEPPSISRERLKLETGNLACRWNPRSTNEKNEKLAGDHDGVTWPNFGILGPFNLGNAWG